jgi:O-antigen ligase
VAVKENRSIRKDKQPVIHLVRFIHIGLYAILLTPLLAWSGFLMPFQTAKVIGFQILVEFVTAAAVILIFMKNASPTGKANFLLSPLFVTLTAFLGYSFLSSLVGLDLNLSVWGFIDRQDGLFLLLHFLAWLVLIAWFFGARESDHKNANSLLPGRGGIRSYLYFSFWVSVAVSLVSLAELEVVTHGIIQPVLEILSSSTRLGGIFGNPLFLGSYLLPHFFFGLYFLTRGDGSIAKNEDERAGPDMQRKFIRFVTLIAVTLGESVILITIAATQTRGVILGLLAGLLSGSILLIFTLPARRVTKTAAVVSIFFMIVLAATVVWRYRDSSLIAKFPVLQRLSHITAGESIGTSVRLLSWGSGLRGFSDHPLLGWGHNNIYYALTKYYDPRLVMVSRFLENPSETLFDKSHNAYIDLLAERGILGALLFLVLLGAIIRSLWWLPDHRLAICLAGGLVAYFVNNLVAFDTFGSLFCYFLALATIATLSVLEPIGRLEALFGGKRDVSASNRQTPSRRRPMLKIFFVLIVLSIGIYLQVEIALANHKCLQAQAAFKQDPGAGVSFYRAAFEHFSPYNAKQKLDCAYLIVRSVVNKRQSSVSFDAGPLVMRLTSEALEAHPLDVDTYMALSDMYNGLALYLNRDFARNAEAFGKKALELSPKRQDAMMHLGRTYVILNEPNKAVELNRRMLQDADFPLGHWLLGLSLLQNNQREEADKEIRGAIQMGYQLTASDIAMLKSLLGEKEAADLAAGK